MVSATDSDLESCSVGQIFLKFLVKKENTLGGHGSNEDIFPMAEEREIAALWDI